MEATRRCRLAGHGAIVAAALSSCLLVLLASSRLETAQARTVVSDSQLQLVNNGDVSIFSPAEARHVKRNHLVNDLLARITAGLSAVSGDEHAVSMSAGDTSLMATTAASATTEATGETATSTSKLATSAQSHDEIESDTSSSAADASDNQDEQDEDEQDCKGLFVDSPGAAVEELPLRGAPKMNDTERLLALQSCLEKKVKRRLQSTARGSLELFHKLSLSGGCSASLMNLMSSLGQLKAFAFKFIDASAKVPSGVMYGLLSDFGDFDQCLSIRSDPRVAPADEDEERAYSGKYCLLNLRLNYHVKLEGNATVPAGIYEDGVLWDELVRNYWTSNSSKGFQVGVCVPSRCSDDDLEQIYRLVAESYNLLGEVISCQDSRQLNRQLEADLLQLLVLYVFALLLVLAIIGTILTRYWSASNRQPGLTYRTLSCFSLQRNWSLFMQEQGASTVLAFNFDKVTPGCGDSNRAQVPTGSLASPSSCTQTTIAGTLVGTNSLADTSSLAFCPRLDGDSSCLELRANARRLDPDQPLTIKISNTPGSCQDGSSEEAEELNYRQRHYGPGRGNLVTGCARADDDKLLDHLSGLKLLVIIWITIGHSFLYPSANNYQYYRSIINMKITRDSVWFAATNFTLGIDMLLYMSGLVFVYKLLRRRSCKTSADLATKGPSCSEPPCVMQELFRKILRFWPTYLSVIAIAIVAPLFGDGPMWPEMVSRRLGDACRKNWWANLLIMNNFSSQTDTCLPSSWFVSVLMQLLIVGSAIMLIARKQSTNLALLAIGVLLACSSVLSFLFAYYIEIKAPVIRMDESFVLELDNNIYRLYTNIFNNMGPFLVGMLGGFMLVSWQTKQERKSCTWQQMVRLGPDHDKQATQANQTDISDETDQTCASLTSKTRRALEPVLIALLVGLVAVLVLSSVFHADYTRFWSAFYWSCHRIGWAVVTGYILHMCATGRCQLMKDLCSLSHLKPFSRLIFIAYLVYPIFIHVHSGLVRDGLHVSIYNMLNIYITRLVFTFSLALVIHLLVELPFCSIEAMLLERWLLKRQSFASMSELRSSYNSSSEDGEERTKKNSEPLLTLASNQISKPPAKFEND